jgi:hypothetical protein
MKMYYLQRDALWISGHLPVNELTEDNQHQGPKPINKWPFFMHSLCLTSPPPPPQSTSQCPCKSLITCTFAECIFINELYSFGEVVINLVNLILLCNVTPSYTQRNSLYHYHLFEKPTEYLSKVNLQHIHHFYVYSSLNNCNQTIAESRNNWRR